MVIKGYLEFLQYGVGKWAEPYGRPVHVGHGLGRMTDAVGYGLRWRGEETLLESRGGEWGKNRTHLELFEGHRGRAAVFVGDSFRAPQRVRHFFRVLYPDVVAKCHQPFVPDPSRRLAILRVQIVFKMA